HSWMHRAHSTHAHGAATDREPGCARRSAMPEHLRPTLPKQDEATGREPLGLQIVLPRIRALRVSLCPEARPGLPLVDPESETRLGGSYRPPRPVSIPSAFGAATPAHRGAPEHSPTRETFRRRGVCRVEGSRVSARQPG